MNKYRLYVIQYDEWGDEEERTIKEGSNKDQMDILFDVWMDLVGPHAKRMILESSDGFVIRKESIGGIDYDEEDD